MQPDTSFALVNRHSLRRIQSDAGRYVTLQADLKTWREHEAERKEWDATLAVGLEPEERWTEDGR